MMSMMTADFAQLPSALMISDAYYFQFNRRHGFNPEQGDDYGSMFMLYCDCKSNLKCISKQVLEQHFKSTYKWY